MEAEPTINPIPNLDHITQLFDDPEQANRSANRMLNKLWSIPGTEDLQSELISQLHDFRDQQENLKNRRQKTQTPSPTSILEHHLYELLLKIIRIHGREFERPFIQALHEPDPPQKTKSSQKTNGTTPLAMGKLHSATCGDMTIKFRVMSIRDVLRSTVPKKG